MKSRKAVTLVLLPMIVLIGAAAWNYSEPRTIAYEINPVTLEVRCVEYLSRPITGMSEQRVVWTEKMAIGKWLAKNEFLKERGAGYWVLCKSYDSRRGFRKGTGRALQSCFDQAGAGTPMPYPSVESPNSQWVEWCSKYPARARFLWETYAELVDGRELRRAGSVLEIARLDTGQFSSDGNFESFVVQVKNE